MNGELTATSMEGTGSVFTLLVALPRHNEDPIVSADRQPGNALLIVDRNPIMRAMFRSLLASHRPHIIQAGSMDEALSMIAAHAPCDVLIDDGVAEGELDRLATAAGACGASVTLLRSAGQDDLRIPQAFSVVGKPVAGPALIDAMFSTNRPEDCASTLVSRAA
jgi:CheY-like chemotaxis protein